MVDPNTPDIVVAATWGGSVWRSADGGVSWKAVIQQRTQWLRIEHGAGQGVAGPRPYYAVGEGTGGQLWRSDDIGVSWKQLQTPLSAQYQQRPLIAASPIFPDTLYLFSPTDQRIFRGEQYGTQWKDVSGNWPGPGDVGQQTYNYCVGCSYTGNPVAGTATDVVYIGLLYVHQSTTGGGAWTPVEGITSGHSDQHALAVNPSDPNHLLIGNDGGVFQLTYVPGSGASIVVGLNQSLAVTEVYRADYAPGDPTNAICGAQDTGSDASLGDMSSWTAVAGGDGGSCAISAIDPRLQYCQSNFDDPNQMALLRTSDLWATNTNILQAPTDIRGSVGKDLRDLKAPIVLDPNLPSRLYVATNYLYRWTDTGASSGNTGGWEIRLGGQQLSSAGWVNAIAVAPGDSDRLYTGSNDNEVWMSGNAGQTWRRVDHGMPRDGGITSISVNPDDANDILVGLWRLTGSSHLWRCQDTGATTPAWADVTSPGPDGLPAGMAVSGIARDPWDPVSTWYAGTDVGVFSTVDAGAHWLNATQPLGLPNVPVSELKVVGLALHAATFGRGIWAIDLLAPAPTPGRPPRIRVSGTSSEVGPFGHERVVTELDVDGDGFSAASTATIFVHGGAHGPIQHVARTANSGSFSWSTVQVRCGAHYDVQARDDATGLLSQLTAITIPCPGS
jgi:hypothetical protein